MKKMLTDSELSEFSGQLAMILHAGISVLEGISLMQDDTPSKEGREILQEIFRRLEETGDLGDALGQTGVYPEYFLKMTEIGETSGTLEDVMASLSDYYANQASVMRGIRSAITYPLVLLFMLLAVLAVLITQVMPVFRQVFVQLGVELTGVSEMVFRLSSFLQRGATLLLAAVIFLSLAVLAALRSSGGRDVLLAWLSHIPFVRRLNRLLACARFSDALSMALHSGLDMGESFDLAAGIAGQGSIQEDIRRAREWMEQGNDLAWSLRQAGLYSGLNARMLSIGYKTGAAETALKKISGLCQEEADQRIQSAAGAVEPALTAVLSILTGMILVAVMLPLLSVMSVIG